MKKQTKIFLALFFSLCGLVGCGEKSGLEGKVLDSKGQPISGLKVIAKQVPPIIKGYGQFETTTSSDGTFKFKKIFPSSRYKISIWDKDWETGAGAEVTAGPEGETVRLEKPIRVELAVNSQGDPINPQTHKIRFTVSGDGVIFDSITGLEWFKGPDKKTTWDQAKDWCADLSVAGGGWRMPTMDELKTLYIEDVGDPPQFKTTGEWVWHTGQQNASTYSSYRSGNGRAFAVRSRE